MARVACDWHLGRFPPFPELTQAVPQWFLRLLSVFSIFQVEYACMAAAKNPGLPVSTAVLAIFHRDCYSSFLGVLNASYGTQPREDLWKGLISPCLPQPSCPFDPLLDVLWL